MITLKSLLKSRLHHYIKSDNDGWYHPKLFIHNSKTMELGLAFCFITDQVLASYKRFDENGGLSLIVQICLKSYRDL